MCLRGISLRHIIRMPLKWHNNAFGMFWSLGNAMLMAVMMTVGKSLKGCKGVGAAGWWGFIGYNYRPGPKPWEAGYHLLPTPNSYQTRSKDTPCSKVVVMVGMVGSVVLVVLVVG